MTGLDLRPLSLGEILDRTFSLYRRHFLLFIGITAIPNLLSLAAGLLQIWFFEKPLMIDRGGRPHMIFMPSHSAAMSFATGLLSLAIGVLVYLWSQAGTISAVTELYLGRQASISASLRRVWDDFASLLGVILLNGLVTAASFILLIVPGVYVACRLLVCLPAALIEGRGPRESLSRSWELTRSYAWRAFVLYLLYFVLVLALGLLVQTPLTLAMVSARDDVAMLRFWMALQQVLSVLTNTLVIPFILIGTSVFYFDLRVRKEAFDLQFMMDPTSERIARGGGSVPSILS